MVILAKSLTDGRRPERKALRWIAGAVSLCYLFPRLRDSLAFAAPRQATQVEAEPDLSQFKGLGFVHDAIGEYKIPRPWVISPKNPGELWDELGVNVLTMERKEQHIVAPQPSERYRPLGAWDEDALVDMGGSHVNASRNPGIRIEHELVSEAEEQQIIEELRAMAATFGYDFAADGEDATAMSWRITGRDEGKSDLPLAPWGWGTQFDKAKLPEGLALVVSRLEKLEGYPLGPIRDVTVNIRSSVDYQMSPHVDPPGDGPNSFVLSLLSGAVVTFSPISALRREAARANNELVYVRQSFTDSDIDCLVPRRAVYHFSGNARYLWTHAIRPPATRVGDGGVEAYERWGTWDRVLRRQRDRAAIIFTFADPPLHKA
mmetsp:Transcript_112750/g.351571  ORF Transcript_112750/g.351571 Transcript_112750/m.351571 type:complete len:375 (+) Transcript_112750:157-1281(+)